jgi:hypothetical protein
LHHVADLAQHFESARVLDRGETEFERVLAGCEGEFVHEGFDRHDIADLAGRPQIRRAQRRAFQPVNHHLHVRHVVGRIAVAGDQPCREALLLRDTRGAGRDEGDMRQVGRRLRDPHFGPPGVDLAIVRQGGLHAQ